MKNYDKLVKVKLLNRSLNRAVVKTVIKYNMLPAIIAQLEQLIAQVEAAGPVADADARLDISTHSQSGHDYARLTVKPAQLAFDLHRQLARRCYYQCQRCIRQLKQRHDP